MPRTALIKSASLSPAEAELADQLARQVANGSFTELVHHFLAVYGAPLSRRLDALQRAGVEPRERLVLVDDGSPIADDAERDFYAPSTWPKSGPPTPPRA